MVTKNHEPVLSAPLADAAGQAGEDFSYVLAADAFSDPDGDALSYSASLADGSALPSWLSFDAAIRPFRRRLDALYEAESKRQAMLVETIHGIATVKAMAIEPLLRGQWEQKVAAAVSMQFRVGRISITARSLTQFLERMMTVILIWVGAGLVFDGSLSVGALIAFQMLAGRVTSPLVRLVGLIHQYQEAALSVEKLGVVMNAREEWGRIGTGPFWNRSSTSGPVRQSWPVALRMTTRSNACCLRHSRAAFSASGSVFFRPTLQITDCKYPQEFALMKVNLAASSSAGCRAGMSKTEVEIGRASCRERV